MRFSSRAVVAAIAVALLAGCSTRDVDTLDVRPQQVAAAQTIALATIAVKTSDGLSFLSGNRGEMMDVLGKFEVELSNALTNQGFTVVPPSQSFAVYDRGQDYEDLYLRRSPDYMQRFGNDPEALKWQAQALAAQYRGNRYKPSPVGTAQTYQFGWNNSTPQTSTEWLSGLRAPAMLFSPNTRMFPEFKLSGQMSLPRYTENGGALDERFTSNAMRGAIGDLTRKAGADAYILLEGNLYLSARQEGVALWAITGGTRYMTFDGTAQLVNADGQIAAVERIRSQAAMPVGGYDREEGSPDRGRGPLGMYLAPTDETLREGAYQAIRAAAVDLAASLAEHRDAGKKAAN